MNTYEVEFLKALQNWMYVANNRPKSGVYQGAYVDQKETSYIDDRGVQRRILAPVPSEDQALDFKCWRLYVYARDKFLASL